MHSPILKNSALKNEIFRLIRTSPPSLFLLIDIYIYIYILLKTSFPLFSKVKLIPTLQKALGYSNLSKNELNISPYHILE
jgi:hypothetical protein